MTAHEVAVAPEFTERHLKVAANYAPPRKGDSKYALPRKTPWIQLKGQWLQEAGFEVDDTIKVRVIKGCLVITAA
ncbi:MAG: SymE family type I addiction module toxin [Pseudomonas sp.]